LNVRNVYFLVDPTVGFADQISCVVQELVLELVQKKIVSNYLFCETQLFLSSFKIKLNIEFLQERRHRIRILILFGLYDLNDLPNCVSDTRRYGCGPRYGCPCSNFTRKDSCCREVPQDPRRRCLNGIKVCWGKESL
jgi:hypothetical protein